MSRLATCGTGWGDTGRPPAPGEADGTAWDYNAYSGLLLNKGDALPPVNYDYYTNN